MTAKTKTAGQTFTASLVKTMGIGGRTRNRNRRGNVREDIIETVQTAATVPGYWTSERQRTLATGYTAINGYRNHILGGRVDSIVCWYVREGLSPYQFAKLLGRMIDADVTNAYQAELFFGSLRSEANTAYAKRYAA
jgi:hypothetical protein